MSFESSQDHSVLAACHWRCCDEAEVSGGLWFNFHRILSHHTPIYHKTELDSLDTFSEVARNVVSKYG